MIPSCSQNITKAQDIFAVDVSEVYSEPRATLQASKHRMRPGSALDLATGWDFARASERKRSDKLLRKEDPSLVILSPPCTARSRIRSLTNAKRDPAAIAAEKEDTRRHLAFAVKIALWQYRRGKGFLLERPAGTGELEEEELRSLAVLPGVSAVMESDRPKLVSACPQKLNSDH